MSDIGKTFWQVNAGHVLTMVTVLASCSYFYGQMSQKLEQHTGQIAALQALTGQTGQAMVALQLSEAQSAQDRADLHKTIEDDFSRRLTKLEDKVDSK